MKKLIYNKISKLIIQKEKTLLDALKQMDSVEKKLLLVFKNDYFINVLSVGDIQRAIIQNIELDTPISEVIREHTRIANQKDSVMSIRKLMKKHRIECMPVINDNNELIEVYFWNEVFGKYEKRININLEIPVVIMAGGKGTRLKPLTNVIPKPLIPIGENTIIEEIMNRFVEVGCNSFFISVNYKAESLKHYFKQLNSNKYIIDYFHENKPLGTAGSLFLIKDKIDTTFFVSNCDIIINEDYSEILKYHKDNKNELTIVSVLKHYPIPYGTIKTGLGGSLLELKEKPELNFQINSGMYILEPHLLAEIPNDTFFHITHLIENVKNRKGKVGVFPVSEGSWTDIGEWDEYIKAIKI